MGGGASVLAPTTETGGEALVHARACMSIAVHELRSLMPPTTRRGGFLPPTSCGREDGSPGTYAEKESPERGSERSHPQPSVAERSQDQSALLRARGADRHCTQESGQAQGHFRKAMNHAHSPTGSLRSPRPAPTASHQHPPWVSTPLSWPVNYPTGWEGADTMPHFSLWPLSSSSRRVGVGV